MVGALDLNRTLGSQSVDYRSDFMVEGSSEVSERVAGTIAHSFCCWC